MCVQFVPGRGGRVGSGGLRPWVVPWFGQHENDVATKQQLVPDQGNVRSRVG